MTDECTKIPWSDVQPGDILMHENGDRLTVGRVDGVWVWVPGSQHNRHYWEARGFTPHRPVPPLDAVPTKPGAYHDKDGEVVVLKIVEGVLSWHDGNFWQSEADMRHRAPFTRLVPMPSSDAVMEVVQRAEPMCMRERITDAVMALLRGGDDE